MIANVVLGVSVTVPPDIETVPAEVAAPITFDSTLALMVISPVLPPLFDTVMDPPLLAVLSAVSAALMVTPPFVPAEPLLIMLIMPPVPLVEPALAVIGLFITIVLAVAPLSVMYTCPPLPIPFPSAVMAVPNVMLPLRSRPAVMFTIPPLPLVPCGLTLMPPVGSETFSAGCDIDGATIAAIGSALSVEHDVLRTSVDRYAPSCTCRCYGDCATVA